MQLQKALDYAFQAFDELCNVKRDRIWFSYEVLKSDQTKRNIRIGLDAWASVAPHFVRNQVIDVHIQPELIVQDVDSTLPPSDLLRTEESNDAPHKPTSLPKSRPSPNSVKPKPVPQSVRKPANAIALQKTSGRSTSSLAKYPRKPSSSGYKLA